ncbi:MAG: hypothetical protein ABL901_00585 [Hyphomicrobiaceae bacterium]
MGLSTLYEFPFGTETNPWRAFARINAEAVCLMTRRSQAYLDLSTRLAGCKTSDDWLTQQVAFWQIAQRQYIESLQTTMLAALPLAPVGESVATVGKCERSRDYIVMPEAPPRAAQAEKDVPATVIARAERVRRSA